MDRVPFENSAFFSRDYFFFLVIHRLFPLWKTFFKNVRTKGPSILRFGPVLFPLQKISNEIALVVGSSKINSLLRFVTVLETQQSILTVTNIFSLLYISVFFGSNKPRIRTSSNNKNFTEWYHNV